MTTREKMDIDERYKYLRIMKPQYKQAKNRQEKRKLLDDMEYVTGLHRKHLIHLMRQRKIERRPRSKERGKDYGPEVDEALAIIWEAQDYICPKRLKPMLAYTAEQLARFGELRLSPRLKEQLDSISSSTIGRHLPAKPTHYASRARKRFQNKHQEEIPIRRIPWDTQEPGHFELDLVHHCGERNEGEYVYTLQIVDVATGWSGRRAILGRSYIVVADALYYLSHQIPFPFLELHPDNGSEFLNAHLLSFLSEHYPQLDRSRSHPRTPNDNRYVEQKNSTLVRAFLGDIRLDTVRQTRYLNRIYDLMHQYHNFIQPVMHQIHKEWVPNVERNSGYTRRWHDDAAPPVVRLCASQILPDDLCRDLLAQRHNINPLALRRNIYSHLQHLFTYPCAVDGQPQSIYQTLAHPELFPDAIAALDIEDAITNSNSDLTTIVKEVGLAVR